MGLISEGIGQGTPPLFPAWPAALACARRPQRPAKGLPTRSPPSHAGTGCANRDYGRRPAAGLWPGQGRRRLMGIPASQFGNGVSGGHLAGVAKDSRSRHAINSVKKHGRLWWHRTGYRPPPASRGSHTSALPSTTGSPFWFMQTVRKVIRLRGTSTAVTSTSAVTRSLGRTGLTKRACCER